MRLADYMAREVAKTGASTVFMLTGGMMMHIMDAFARVPSFKYYCNHHEQASGMAADGYARFSGKPGVCLATSGPGATNLLTAIVGAYQDSIPIIFITGQCKRPETVQGRGIPGLRQCGFLEADIVPMVQSTTKYAAFIKDPADIRFHVEKAIHLATTGRPGPVLLDVPLDVQGASIDPETLQGFTPEPQPAAAPSAAELQQLLDAIAAAKRPLIVAGHGIRCAGQAERFRRLITRWQIPVAATALAKDLLPEECPLFVGHPGHRSHRGANFVIQSADLIVFMGASIHVQNVGYEGDLFAPNARKIQIELDPAVRSREHIGVQQKYAWDLAQCIPALDAAVQAPWQAQGSRWTKTARGWFERFSNKKESHLLGEPGDRVNLYEFADVLSTQLRGDETILTDAGQPYYILGQGFRLKGAQRYLVPGSLAEMGWALPASFGVAAGHPAGAVIPIIGDGSLQTNIQELQTLRTHQFNIKLIVINNDGYASIRATQKTFFNGFYVGSTRDSGVTLPDLKKICAAYELPYLSCPDRASLAESLRQALDTPGPLVVEIMAQIDQRVLPGVPTQLLPDGSIRSKALHEMVPDIGVTLDQLAAEL